MNKQIVPFQANYVRNDQEITEFKRNFEGLIKAACKRADLPECDWDCAVSAVVDKFAQGRFKHNGRLGKSFASYVYQAADWVARGILRNQHPGRYVSIDESEQEKFFGVYGVNFDNEDERIIVGEALRRLFREMKDKCKFDILVRYVLKREERKALAAEFHESEDAISLVKTRYKPLLSSLIKTVMREDENGCLNLSEGIQFDFYDVA